MYSSLTPSRSHLKFKFLKLQPHIALHAQICHSSNEAKPRGRPRKPYTIFFHDQLKAMNSALNEDQKPYSAKNLLVKQRISEQWNAMSEEQRTAVTGTGVHARPKIAALGKREKQTNSQKTRRAEELLESLRQELSALRAEDGHDAKHVTRTVIHQDDDERLSVFHSQRKIIAYWDPTTFPERHYVENVRETVKAGALSLDELKNILDRLPENHRTPQALLQMHKGYTFAPKWEDLLNETFKFTKAQLREITGGKAERMFYTTFDRMITERLGVTISGWPLPTFLPRPRNMREMITRYLAWRSGAMRFRKLEPEEKKLWDETRVRLRKEREKWLASSGVEGIPPAPPSGEKFDASRALGTIDQVAMFLDLPVDYERYISAETKAILEAGRKQSVAA
ncbi:hypothetical protein BC629DRAFT_926453 [Irpex lacteus]|nr:hypothetical protein BC629DRAFT_926453 [Irpex lacteus]